MGGREIGENQITDLLWPDADGDAAHRVFATTLHRLRTLLGIEEALLFVNGRLTLDTRYCHVDAWAFERHLGKSDALIKNGNRNSAIRLIEQATVKYQGPFLENESLAPVVLLREELRSKYLKYVGVLGTLFEEKGDFQKGVEVFRKGIEVEPLAEEFYQNLMTCYQKLGRPCEAVTVYTRLKRTLATSLGIRPSSQTEMIYKQLVT